MHNLNSLMAATLVAAVLSGAAVASDDPSQAEALWGYAFKRTDAGPSIYYLDYESSSEKIEITVIEEVDRELGEQMITEKVFLFGSLFERQRVGYPGQHTEYIDCPPHFKPSYGEKPVAGGIMRYFEGFANTRFSFGACNEESAAFVAVNAYLYCDDAGAIYDINYFSLKRSRDEAREFVDRIRCRQEPDTE